MTEPEAALWMRRLADLSRNQAALPDPALIWWQARLLEKHEARTRAARPVAIAQWASAVVAVASMVVLCLVYSPGIQAMLRRLFAG